MRRRSTNGRPGVLTRSRKQLMQLQGYLPKEKVVSDTELDEYINHLDDKIDATQDVMAWGDDDDDSSTSDGGDSDEDQDDDADYNPRRGGGRKSVASSSPGFVSHVLWSSIGPCLVVPVLYHRWSHSTYPLSTPSLVSYMAIVCLNWITFVLLTCLIFAGSCNTPSFLRGFLFKVPLDVPSCASAVWTPLRDCVVMHGVQCFSLPSCQLPLGQLAGAVVGLGLLATFHRRRVQVVVGVLFVVHHGLQWAHHTSARSFFSDPSPQSIHITSIDPVFAYANESIHVLLDGLNLHEGMQVGWVPFWGCSRDTPLSACPVELVAALTHGGVTQTFSAVDEYTACISLAGTTAPSAAFACFPDVRLKVKHVHSTPGWSLQQQG
ncbi:hypothetical protein DYB37_012176 [Aphanomyces astaci]|uniref:Transmembrane protein n=1 Tax=Aphanomyces astaci TaxID=112090 RepID=A0A418DIC4_APHAT|nr:hypothetical protein DYB35_002611 [Aphanomyces astaci]RHZ11270.1 hypothetical protein DYB37_012176 [Aphanomyces astaci]